MASLKTQRSRIQDSGHPKPGTVSASSSRCARPNGEPRIHVPVPPRITDDCNRRSFVHCISRVSVVVPVPAVLSPFPNVAVHVVKAPRVRRKAVNRSRPKREGCTRWVDPISHPARASATSSPLETRIRRANRVNLVELDQPLKEEGQRTLTPIGAFTHSDANVGL
jgi:hypothetical protein